MVMAREREKKERKNRHLKNKKINSEKHFDPYTQQGHRTYQLKYSLDK